MTPDREANGDYQAGDQDCHPAAGAEFLIDQYHQDGARHEESAADSSSRRRQCWAERRLLIQ